MEKPNITKEHETEIVDTDVENYYTDNSSDALDVSEDQATLSSKRADLPSMMVHQEITDSNGSVAFVTCGHPHG